jgi:hypothetical protein
MPFYLIKQTLLVEANNELAAARNAADIISSAQTLKFEVKLDESAKWHLQVPFSRDDLAGKALASHPDQAVSDQHPAERKKCQTEGLQDERVSGVLEPAADRPNGDGRKRATALTFGIGVLLGLVPCLVFILIQSGV